MADHPFTVSEQTEWLLQAPAAKSMSEKDGFTYVGHQFIRVNLNRIFGFGRWSFTVDNAECIHEGKVPSKRGGENWNVTYRVTGTLSVTFADGSKAQYTEVAVDSSFHPQYDQCHDHAVKGAASSALRRASMNLGSVFGLGLYFSDPHNSRSSFKGEIVRYTVDTRDRPAAPPRPESPEGDATGEPGPGPEKAAQSLGPDSTVEELRGAIDDLQAQSTTVSAPEWDV